MVIIPSSYNNQNTKLREQRNYIKSCKGKGPRNMGRYSHYNNTELLSRKSESQKILERCLKNPETTDTAQTTMYSPTISHYGWRLKICHIKTTFKQYLFTNSASWKALEEIVCLKRLSTPKKTQK